MCDGTAARLIVRSSRPAMLRRGAIASSALRFKAYALMTISMVTFFLACDGCCRGETNAGGRNGGGMRPGSGLPAGAASRVTYAGYSTTSTLVIARTCDGRLRALVTARFSQLSML